MKTILSTKKLKKVEREFFSDADFIILEKKFIKTKAIEFEVKNLNEYVVLTSKNAVKSILKNKIASQVKERKIVCVGQKTKEFLQKKGFTVEDYADYANDLGILIIEKYSTNSFTFFSGNIRRNTLPDLFKENNIQWNEVVVYQTTLNPKKVTEHLDGILFFSPSAIESYLIKNEIKNEMCFCIGTTTANALENITKNISIASPTIVESVIDQVIKYYK